MSKTKVIAAVVAVLVLVPIGCSVLNTTAAVTTAPGRVVQKTLQTDNIIGSYAAFFNRKAAYDARLSQIEGHKVVISATQDPAELSRLRMELGAMRQSCRESALAYNADTLRADKALFQSNNLPASLSETACD